MTGVVMISAWAKWRGLGFEQMVLVTETLRRACVLEYDHVWQEFRNMNRTDRELIAQMKPASPRTTGNHAEQNRPKPCGGKPFHPWKELKFESQKGNSRLSPMRVLFINDYDGFQKRAPVRDAGNLRRQ